MSQKSQWNASLYDDKHSFVWKMAAAVLDLLDVKRGEHILDLGCGTGHLTAKIAATGATVIGIDKSPEMIQQAREQYPSLRFEVMDARELTFPGPFDAVFSNATLHWIKEPQKVIAAIAKILRPGGRFVAEFGGKGNVAELTVAVQRACRRLSLSVPAPDAWYFPSVAEYSTQLERHGLEVTYAYLFDRPTPLEDGERGLQNWLNMFGSAFGDPFPTSDANLLVAIEQEARPALYRDGHWAMDYRRLRIVAHKNS
jgi:trans-aconitate methyltransferase